LGSYSQVGRCLQNLCRDQQLIRIGLGIYAKTKVYPKPPLAGHVYTCRYLPFLAKEALLRMEIEVVPSQVDLDYASGQSTQIPTGKRIGIKGRKITRLIGYNNLSVNYEYVD
jgi:hypothetical protein